MILAFLFKFICNVTRRGYHSQIRNKNNGRNMVNSMQLKNNAPFKVMTFYELGLFTQIFHYGGHIGFARGTKPHFTRD